jgi:putative transposase
MHLIEAACPLRNGKHKGVMRAIEEIRERIECGDPIYTGQANLANDRKRTDGLEVSPRSLMRWWSAWLESGRNLASLAPNDGDVKRIEREKALVGFVRDFNPRAGSWLVPAGVPAWLPWFLIGYRKGSSPSIPDAIRDMKRDMPQEIERPSYHQVLRITQKLPKVYTEKSRKTGAELKALMSFNRRVWKDYDPFTCGQIDGHSFKAYVAHPVSGAHFHPELCAMIDMTTKMVTGYSAGLAESQYTVADAFRHSCTINENKPIGGRYLITEPDMGSGNMAKVNADRDIGLFARVGTLLCFPEVAGNPQGHGGIERVNQSLWIRAAKELPTYTGKDMDRVTRKKVYTKLQLDLKAAKKAGELGKVEKTSKLLLTWREFLAALAIWVAEYNNTPHRSLPKITDGQGRRRHRSPNEEYYYRIEQGWDPQDAMADQELLDHLFMPHQRIKINRCEFRLHGNRYHSHALHTHHGEQMVAAYDIHNADEVMVLNLDGRLICTAKWNGNDIHGVPTTKLEQADYERVQGQLKLNQQKRDMIEANTYSGSPAEEQPEHIQQEVLQISQQLQHEKEAALVADHVMPVEPQKALREWQRLDAVKLSGGVLSPSEENSWKSWQNSDMWKGWKAIQEG